MLLHCPLLFSVHVVKSKDEVIFSQVTCNMYIIQHKPQLISLLKFKHVNFKETGNIELWTNFLF